ncbi:MAG: DedA family protein [Armatimonadetes bacterium]|nr:MAG: DedA family protein [Armatimonadota bacterium]MCE7898543.1 DedA family protein [Armatimonadetes bacterium ATM1]MDL1928164.1 DedA family protein [Fimbriimonadia bacterium ATM]MBC6968618.1 DedA family protein [Armatimonadota bacterium]MBL1148783.1 DedA family protein [Armatimonadota bacterium]
MFESVLAFLERIINPIMESGGYAAVVGLMALESACLPVPSELVMPFAGMLSQKGLMNFHLASIAGALGCAVGSAGAYWVGASGGRALLVKYGKYVLIREKELAHADEWFAKYGQWAAFLARFLPIIRTFISLPAGIHRVRFWPFLGLSFAGSLPWCYGLAAVGMYFQEYRPQIREYFHIVDYAIVGSAVVAVAWWIWRKRRARTQPA